MTKQKIIQPDISGWISASAGTGKTKILIDRFLRLLLEDVKVESILCITFTKAAAAEMQRRLTNILKNWAICDETTLEDQLLRLLDEPIQKKHKEKARSLFSYILDSLSFLNIKTIHGFCSDIIKHFPFETNIPPFSELLEEGAVKTLLKDIQTNIIINAKGDLYDAFAFLGKQLSKERIEQLFYDLLLKRRQFSRCIYRDDYEKCLINFFSIDTAEEPKAPTLNEIIYILKQFVSEKEVKVVNVLLSDDETEKENVFLTKKGDIRKRFVSADIMKKFPYIHEMFFKAAMIYKELKELKSHKIIIELTMAFITVAKALFYEYKKFKEENALIDFDDLLIETNKLFSNNDLKNWIFYKFNCSIDHILLDEAQDTSPEQWEFLYQFITFLLKDGKKSLFVVGDLKQSIYRFQGANPDLVSVYYKKFKILFEKFNLPFMGLDLERSYRTVPLILKTVDKVFHSNSKGVGHTKHIAHREDFGGQIELFPLVSQERITDEKKSWPLPTPNEEEDRAYAKLAKQIADKVKDILDKGHVLQSTQKKVQPNDFFILSRRRSSLTDLVISELKKRNIPTTSYDRMPLTQHIIVQDLLAFGRFLVSPYDDYALACVLKSPLINKGQGISEEELFAICSQRKGTIFELIIEKKEQFRDIYNFLNYFLELIDNKSPFELFYELTTQTKQFFLARFGEEASEFLYVFLEEVFLYTKANNPSLEGFLSYMSSLEKYVVNQKEEVRVITIHGSKGLEAPIVIIADATDPITLKKENFLWISDDAQFVLRPSLNNETGIISEIKQEALEKLECDHQRLFYVALTRAKDQLYMFGLDRGSEETWYHNVQAALGKNKVWTAPTTVQNENIIKIEACEKISLPCYFNTVFALPTTEKKDSPAIKRGVIIHKLFEILSSYKGENVESFAKQWILKRNFESLIKRDDISNIISIMTSSIYKHLFGGDSLSEIDIFDGNFHGRIDRLWISDKNIEFVDFKTHDLNSLLTVREASKKQILKYKNVLQKLYSNHSICAFLLWTEGPFMEEVT
ncbi:MAG: UvrD-helicase domain-containing protein [Alphaproteobacteria bacterium]